MELNKILSCLTLLILFPVADFAELWTYTKSPESVTAPLNDTVVFTCQTNITADRVVWWHRHVSHGHTSPWIEVKSGNAKVRSSSGHRNAPKPNHKLTVPFRNESLAGEYRCVSWFGASGLASVVAKLTKADLIESTKHFDDRHLEVAPDSYVLLRCPRPQSEPPANILYYEVENDNPILVNSDKDAGDALLVHLKAGESKIYSCAAENLFAKNKRIEYRHRIKVDVVRNSPQLPKFTDEMLKKVIAKEGESITLGCAVIGFPAPIVTWRRARGLSMPKHSSTENTLLHIPHLQVQDQGEYICHASNNVGSKEERINLIVHQPPQIIPGEHDNTGEEGGKVRIGCGKKLGIPSPSLYWMINGVEVKNNSNIKVYENEIEINPLEKRHAGLVQCFAVNSVGSVFSASLLQVLPKQHMPTYPDEKNFDSKTNGMPGHRHRGHKGRREMIPPSQPHVTRLSDESVMVRWSVEANNGLPIKFFKIQYRDLNQTSTRGEGGQGARWNTSAEEISPHIRSYAIDGLTSSHLYRFRITAVYSNDDNKQGPNSSRFMLLQGTDSIKVPQAPVFTHAEAISPTELLLHWELPTNISKDIPEPDGFYVYYRLSTNAGEYTKAAVEGGKARSQILGHLLPGISYEIKLQSFTPIAASDFSQIIAQKTKKSPTIEKINDVTTIPSPGVNSGASTNLRVYGIAGGAVGGMLILAFLIFAIILCKKRRGRRPDKQVANRSGDSGSRTEGMNGFLPTAGPISNKGMTIRSNPMPQEVRVKT